MKKNIAIITVFVVLFVILLVLVQVENKRMFYDKYGVLAVDAETDERAAFILENYDKFPSVLLVSHKIDHTDIRENYDLLYNYFDHKDDNLTMTFTEEELNSELPPRLYMSDYRWCYEPIGSSMIVFGGCGAVSLSMAHIWLTDTDEYDPAKAAKVITDCGAWSYWGGFDTSYIVEVCAAMGLKAEPNFYPNLDADDSAEQTIKDIIDSGHVCMLSLSGTTFGGHVLLAVDYNDEGLIFNDPASPEKSDMVWDFSKLKQEIYGIYDISVEN